MKNNIIITIVLVIVVAFGGFFAGMKYQQKKQPTFGRQFGNALGSRMGGQLQNGNRLGFRPVAGEIIESDENSIIVKLQDGSSKIVLLSEKTEINKTNPAAQDELKVGEKVSVFGTENSDGSVTASNIQLNPIIRTPTESGNPQ